MRTDPRKTLVVLITFFAGLYFFLEFLLPDSVGGFRFGQFHQEISTGVQAVGTMGIALGLINIFFVHGTAIVKTRKGWLNSLVLVVGMITMFVVLALDFANSQASLASWKPLSELQKYLDDITEKNAGDPATAASRIRLIAPVVAKAQQVLESTPTRGSEKAQLELTGLTTDAAAKLALVQDRVVDAVVQHSQPEPNPEALTAALVGLRSALKDGESVMRGHARFVEESAGARRIQRVLYEGFFVSLGSAMFSLLAFYIATAAYRTFRIRSWEAAVMMAAALLVMLGQMAHGPIYISEDLPEIRRWFLRHLNTPAFRAIYFGSMLAGLSMAVRMWLSLERNVLVAETEDSSPPSGAGKRDNRKDRK